MNLSIFKTTILWLAFLSLPIFFFAACSQKRSDARYDSLKQKEYLTLNADDKKYFTNQLTLRLRADEDFQLANKYMLEQEHRFKLMMHLSKYVAKFPELNKLDKSTKRDILAQASR